MSGRAQSNLRLSTTNLLRIVRGYAGASSAAEHLRACDGASRKPLLSTPTDPRHQGLVSYSWNFALCRPGGAEYLLAVEVLNMTPVYSVNNAINRALCYF